MMAVEAQLLHPMRGIFGMIHIQHDELGAFAITGEELLDIDLS
jgi:hypothetical protein